MRSVVVALLCVACGRLRFDPVGDAGAMGDGSGSDADTDAATLAETCASRPNVLFCSSFENDLADWTLLGGAAQVVTSPVHGGSRSLQSSIQAAPEYVLVDHVVVPSIGALTQLYLRAWFYAPGTFSYDHTNLLNLSAANGQGISIVVMGGNLQLYRDTGQAMSSPNGPVLPKGGWHCVEMALNVADVGGTWALQLDDQVVIAQPDLDSRPTGGFDRVQVGIPFSGAAQTGPATVYLDDVVLDDTPIGCLP